MRKRILFITSRPIYPIVGGDQIRTAQCLQYLRSYFDVHEVVIGTTDDLPQPEKYDSYKYFKVAWPTHYWQAIHFLFNSDPIQVNYYYSLKVQRYIDRIINDFEIVFCNNIRTAKYVLKHSSKVRIIDFVDSISMNYEKARYHAKFPMNLIYTIDYHRCKQYELHLLKEFDRASVISDKDRNYILHNSEINRDLKVIGNMAKVSDAILPERANSIVFIGKMNYAPNVIAVRNFLKNTFPLILKSNPLAVFYVVGTQPTQEIRDYNNGKNIIVTGFVEDMNAYLDKAEVVDAPMISGAGIQNKIIQAMGRGKCVVATPIGAEGLDIRNDEIGIADNDSDMAAMIVSLLQNPKRRKLMGSKAKEYIKKYLSYEAIGVEFEKLLNGLY